MQRFVLILMFLGLAASPAYAQVDLRPVATQAIEWAGVALMAGGGVLIAFVLNWLAKKTRMEDSEFEALLATRLNDILHRAIEHAVVIAQNEVNKPGSGLKAVKFDNFFINVAVNYAVKSMPDIIAHFALTRERLEEMITARLSSWLGDVPPEGGASTITKSADEAKQVTAAA